MLNILKQARLSLNSKYFSMSPEHQFLVVLKVGAILNSWISERLGFKTPDATRGGHNWDIEKKFGASLRYELSKFFQKGEIKIFIIIILQSDMQSDVTIC